ncbi:MAG: LamG domain-containing protein [Planctomycetota bacterium]
MESYDDTDNQIWETWLDGPANLTGSRLGLGTDPNHPVHGGDKSMLYYYDNNHPPIGPLVFEKYSEIERTFADPRDWTAHGLAALTLYFYGDPNNDANDTEQMYVGLKDCNGVYAEVRYGDNGEDMNDLKAAQWHEWNIALKDFNNGGVDLTDVCKIYIGFGDRADPTTGGSGTLYFDDIRLYQRRCFAEHVAPADFTADCMVDCKDLRMLARDWLLSEGIIPAVEPDSNGLLLLYKFDESWDYTAFDSSGRGYDGYVYGPESGWDPCNGYHAGCRIFSDDTAVSVPADVLSNVNQGITILLWVKDAWRPDAENVVFETGSGDFFLEADVPRPGGAVYWRAGYDSIDELWWHSSAPSDWKDSWSHYAFVKDANQGIMRLYHNASLVAQKTDASNYLAGVQGAPFDIGALLDHDNDFIGRMDDFKVYDYVLSQAEIAGAATDGGDLYVPLPVPPVDLYKDGKVNFRDHAILADTWLKDSLWPSEE